MDSITAMSAHVEDDELWYSTVIDCYTPYVTAIISGIAKGALTTSDIEEVAADVFFKIWQRREQLRPDTLKGFIAQVARTTCIDRLRKENREMVPYEDDILPVRWDKGPDELAIAREQKQIMEATVHSFGEPDREIFIRFYYFGESIQAISGRLQLNASTTKTKLRRARIRLKAILQERGYTYE